MRRLFVGLIALLAFSAGSAHDLAKVMNEVSPSVVYIRVEAFVMRDTLDPVTKLTERVRVPTTPIIGTGFVIQGNRVVTNQHVVDFSIKNNTDIYVTFQGNNQRYKATVVGYDKIADVAVLEIPGEHPSVLIEVEDELRMGDPVFSISHFYGIGWSATQGTVSSNDRRDTRYPYINNLQLQLLQGSGSSGGPVFNEKGHVVALNRSIVSMFPRGSVPTGRASSMLSMVGYPVRADTLVESIYKILEDQIVVYLDLDVSLLEFGPNGPFHLNYASGDSDYPVGVMVFNLDKDAETTLKNSDIIISIDGNEFTEPVDLYYWLNTQDEYKAGDTVNVQVYRDTEILNIAVPITMAGL